MAIIGSGYIAVEFAGIFAGLGSHVDLIYRQPFPAARLRSRSTRGYWPKRSAHRAFRFHPGCLPRRLEAHGDERMLSYSDGQTLRADLVFFATSRAPATNDLGLETAGVKTNKMTECWSITTCAPRNTTSMPWATSPID